MKTKIGKRQARILNLLVDAGGTVPAGSRLRAADVGPAQHSNLLATMRAKGLVEIDDSTDRFSKSVTITAAGRKAIGRA